MITRFALELLSLQHAAESSSLFHDPNQRRNDLRPYFRRGAQTHRLASPRAAGTSRSDTDSEHYCGGGGM